MSLNWDSVRSHDGKQGADSSAGATPPAALSQNPLAHPGPPTRRERPGVGPVYTPQTRPDLGFWDFVYWAGWALTGFLGLVLGASVAKAIRYGVITDIINWMLGR